MLYSPIPIKGESWRLRLDGAPFPSISNADLTWPVKAAVGSFVPQDDLFDETTKSSTEVRLDSLVKVITSEAVTMDKYEVKTDGHIPLLGLLPLAMSSLLMITMIGACSNI